MSSTQDALKKLLDLGAPNKTTVFTYKQTHGRGRNQSQWQTLPGKHLFFSHAQNLKIPNKDIAKISLLVGIALRDSLEQYFNIKAKIKWPNDLYIENKKLSGILCEVTQINSKYLCIIGIGININLGNNKIKQNEFSPAFAQNYTDLTIHPWHLLGKAIQSIDTCLANIEYSFLKLQKNYHRYDYLFNKVISVNTGTQTYQGQAKGINEDGALLLEIKDNKTIPIYSGHISF
ncbi:MAG TPA: biotin--[acetyl-CoA-carboxylase] ligase [Oligoflexia bacterium]|nr:biotin--[acetyl-CoA-carboxylase] ligase [Oligoflexia bacterium]HMR23753.1 biotin--[acetyl-CoA-carboxylase] ligase [Oligoflexia bacterium]